MITGTLAHLPTLILAGLLFWSSQALAQGGLGQLPACAIACVQNVAQAHNCVLTTAACLCPFQFDIHNCITQSCSIEDLAAANTIIGTFCLGASLPGQPSYPPVVTTPSTTPTPPLTTTPPGHPPITTESQSPPIVGLPTSTPSSLPIALPSVSPSLPSPSITTSSGIPTSAILSLPTTDTPSISAAPQTVVVFSTAFAPPSSSSTNGASGLGCRRDGVVLLISMICSGIVWIFFVV